MSNLFIKSSTGLEWGARQLDGKRTVLALGGDGRCELRHGSCVDLANGNARIAGAILSTGAARGARGAGEHYLLTRPDATVPIRVNGDGDCVALGLRLLRHKDELLIGGSERVFFSSEIIPVIAPFEGGADGQGVFCPRCHDVVAPQALSVTCTCGAVFHRNDDRACYDFGPTCPVCAGFTTLSGQLSWTPEKEFERQIA